MNEKQYMLVKVIQKIEVFKHFDGTDVQRLLKVCKFRNFQQGEHIYTRGEASDEMLILLKGQLRVVSPSGDDLAVIQPGNPIGEMGLFTGQPRSADIVANDKSTAIVLRDEELKGLLAGAIDMHIKVLYNVISTLSQRVADANGLTEIQARLIRDLKKKPEDDDEDEDEYDEDEIYVEQA